MSVLDRPRERSATTAGRASRTGRSSARLWVGAALVLLLAGWLLAPYVVRVERPMVTLDEDAGLMVEGYGAAGTYALDYRFGEELLVTVPVTNDSPVPLRVERVELVEPAYPLLEPVPGDSAFEPFTVLPGRSDEVVLAGLRDGAGATGDPHRRPGRAPGGAQPGDHPLPRPDPGPRRRPETVTAGVLGPLGTAH